MNPPNRYGKVQGGAQDHSSDTEDDLDLDELDPITGSAVNRGSRVRSAGVREGWRSPVNGSAWSIGGKRNGSRGWDRKNEKVERAADDLEGLLRHEQSRTQNEPENEAYPDDRRYFRRGRRRGQQRQLSMTESVSSAAPHALHRLRSSIQLPESLRQGIASAQDEIEVNNKEAREIAVGQAQSKKFSPNVISNAKYTAWSFLPRTLYNEFSFFLNIYFLLVALSQVIPYLRIGYMSTYIAPLAMVLTISIGKEAVDDIARRRRDAEANAEPYTVLSVGQPPSQRRTDRSVAVQNEHGTEITKKSRDLKVGDILKLQKNQRLPADVVILKSLPQDSSITIKEDAVDQSGAGTGTSGATTAEHQAVGTGETFIRTDQLDGETDWKLRLPSALSQALPPKDLQRLKITAGAPEKNVNDFVGTIELLPSQIAAYDPHMSPEDGDPASLDAESPSTEQLQSAPLTVDNTAWANTVLASNTVTLAVIIYTGRQTRSALSTSPSRSKTGLLEYEINNLTKILCALTLTLSVVLVALEGFEPHIEKPWYVAIMIYLILFSTIIPISLRVNLDMGKSVYAYFIERDQGIPGAVVRTSTIPEDLGRIEYLLSDKTGTLTQNEMELKKIHVGTVSYAGDAMQEVESHVSHGFGVATDDVLQPSFLVNPLTVNAQHNAPGTITRTRREIGSRVRDLMMALALCHNVTPTTDEVDGKQVVTYQASSPDEIAIVQFCESVGLRLLHRDRQTITLQSISTSRAVVRVSVQNIFPFTSESKRMGIIVRFSVAEEQLDSEAILEDDVWFYQKGADTVMTNIVAANDWLDEETANMAREGLRTLVVGRKRLTADQYRAFSEAYHEASLALHNRDEGMSAITRQHLEHNLELLGVTGVEDKLQKDVKPSLELLRNAGVKIWMLTGDKVETARCVAVSSRLVSRTQSIHTVVKLRTKASAEDALSILLSKPADTALLIDGESLHLMLTQLRHAFIGAAVRLPAVIASRCSPTQKADVALLIRQHTKKRTCCIGDGGNDVSMIQAADVGIGIVGKEGRQASLAADFSVTQFCHVTKLLVWHGRNSYKRSAKLAQFIIHRGLIISVCQTMYSIAGHFDPKGLFKDWLLVGYATVYTMFPVFSLTLDRDVDEGLANLYPELYKELKTGRSLSYGTFFTWVAVSIYQGVVIQGLSQLLVGQVDGPKMLSVSFTVLVLNELIMVAVAVTTWHPITVHAQIFISGVGNQLDILQSNTHH